MNHACNPGAISSGHDAGIQVIAAGAMLLSMKTTAFTLCADESTKVAVRRVADGLIDAALRRARRPSRDAAEDVHFLRTTTKRLRALLQLIRPVIARTAFEGEDARLKRVAGWLAPLRDRAVARATLQALSESPAILSRLRLADSSGKTPATGNRRSAMRAAARELEESRGSFQRLRIGGEGWDTIGPGLTKTYTQARQRMKAAFAHPDDRAFHRWRIRVKQLYCQLQWIEAIWPKRFGRMLDRLHKLDEILGADHDLVLLREVLEKIPEGWAGTEALERVKKAAGKKGGRLRRTSEPLGAKALGETPRRFRRRCKQRWQAWEIQGRRGRTTSAQRWAGHA